MVDDVLIWLTVACALTCSGCESSSYVSGCLEVVSLSSDGQTTRGEASMNLNVESLEDGRVWLDELYLASSSGSGEQAVSWLDPSPFPMKANDSALSASFGFTTAPPFEPQNPRLRAVFYAEDLDRSNAWGDDGFLHIDVYFNDYHCPSQP